MHRPDSVDQTLGAHSPDQIGFRRAFPNTNPRLTEVFRRYVHERGVKRATHRAFSYLRTRAHHYIRRVMVRILRRSLEPSISDFARAGFRFQSDIVELLDDAMPGLNWADRIAELAEDHERIWRDLEQRRSSKQLRYPSEFAIRRVSSFAIYCIVRALAPESVLETGVANGESTVVLLNAIRRNGTGRLYSIDIDPSVGSLVSQEEKTNWTLLLLDRDRFRPRAALRKLISEVPAPGLMIHDSDHGYDWQLSELEEFGRVYRPGSILAVDDADNSYATIDFCKAHRFTPLIILDGTKAFCLMTRPEGRVLK